MAFTVAISVCPSSDWLVPGDDLLLVPLVLVVDVAPVLVVGVVAVVIAVELVVGVWLVLDGLVVLDLVVDVALLLPPVVGTTLLEPVDLAFPLRPSRTKARRQPCR